jgi:HSP20 family protein
MSILEKTKNIGTELESGLEKGYKKSKELLKNVASHLPFTNFAKDKTGDFHLEVDLPGVKKKDIDVRVENNVLIVSAQREMKKEVDKDDYYLLESSFGKIERFFTLPDDIDTDRISADYKNGRLLIDLEKKENERSKAIEIKSSN